MSEDEKASRTQSTPYIHTYLQRVQFLSYVRSMYNGVVGWRLGNRPAPGIVCTVCMLYLHLFNDFVAWQSRISLTESPAWLSSPLPISKGRELRSTYCTEKRHCRRRSRLSGHSTSSTTVVLAASGHSSVFGAREIGIYEFPIMPIGAVSVRRNIQMPLNPH